MGKNSETVGYTIRVKKELKDTFVKCCQNQDTDSSKEIRAFMRSYIKKNGQKQLL